MLLSCQQRKIVNNVPSNVSFHDYLDWKKESEKADSLYRGGQYISAIELYQGMNLKSYYSIAECYMRLNNKEQAIANVKEAFLQGYLLEHVDQELFSPVWSKIEGSYLDYRRQYLSTIDTTLYNELYLMYNRDQLYRGQIMQCSNNNRACIDSLMQLQAPIDEYNIQRLREITVECGWPSRKVIGFDHNKPMFLFAFVAHSSEADNIYFLDIVIQEAKQNKVSWNEAGNLMTYLLFKHAKNNFVKLRNTYANEDGSFDIKASTFQLYYLVKLMRENPQGKIALNTVYYPAKENEESVSKYKPALYDIRDYLVNQGADPERILISNELVEGESDGLGFYRFGFTTIR